VPSFSNGAYIISEEGEYDLSGTLVGMIYVHAEDGEVVLNLNGVTMSYASNSVIYCDSGDKLEISAKKGTTNTITDLRSVQTEDVDGQGGGVIYSKVDTKLKGTGELSVIGTYNNGIHVTKDLEIQKLTLTAKAINNALKGNDSLTINSGNITAISSGGDALKTTDSDVSSKGNQRGDVTILGGTVNLYSACDGVQAAHDFILGAEGSEEEPTVTVKTNKYSSYTNADDIIAASETTMYLKMNVHDTAYRYGVYFYNDAGDTNGVWADATYKTSQTSGRGFGGSSTYYIYELDRPTAYASFAVYAFNAGSADSLTDYVCKTSGNTVNTSADMVSVTHDVSSKKLSTGSWSTYSSSSSQGGMGGPGGGPGGFPGGSEGNKDKADVSAKGVKAQNNIYILSGSLDITAYDDGLHANYGETLDSGETSTGDVYIKGGTTTVSCSDDGVHADRYLKISGGNTTVTSSYEGLEGNQITVSGGTAVAYASDDGVNAGNGEGTAKLSPTITVSGGHLFAAVPSSGDTDGIDSNGSFTQTGGEVIAAGPNSNFASAALDTDGGVTVSSGTLLVFGGIEKTPSCGNGVTKSSKSGSYGNASHVVTFGSGSVNVEKLPNSNYSVCNAYSILGSITSIS
jgi:hypothetical protein